MAFEQQQDTDASARRHQRALLLLDAAAHDTHTHASGLQERRLRDADERVQDAAWAAGEAAALAQTRMREHVEDAAFAANDDARRAAADDVRVLKEAAEVECVRAYMRTSMQNAYLHACEYTGIHTRTHASTRACMQSEATNPMPLLQVSEIDADADLRAGVALDHARAYREKGIEREAEREWEAVLEKERAREQKKARESERRRREREREELMRQREREEAERERERLVARVEDTRLQRKRHREMQRGRDHVAQGWGQDGSVAKWGSERERGQGLCRREKAETEVLDSNASDGNSSSSAEASGVGTFLRSASKATRTGGMEAGRNRREGGEGSPSGARKVPSPTVHGFQVTLDIFHTHATRGVEVPGMVGKGFQFRGKQDAVDQIPAPSDQEERRRGDVAEGHTQDARLAHAQARKSTDVVLGGSTHAPSTSQLPPPISSQHARTSEAAPLLPQSAPFPRPASFQQLSTAATDGSNSGSTHSSSQDVSALSLGSGRCLTEASAGGMGGEVRAEGGMGVELVMTEDLARSKTSETAQAKKPGDLGYWQVRFPLFFT